MCPVRSLSVHASARVHVEGVSYSHSSDSAFGHRVERKMEKGEGGERGGENTGVE